MRRLFKHIADKLPQRRNRSWRYVSPQRHGAGLVALALLVLIAYVYWYQTNDRRIRGKAEDYLAGLTGAKVRLGNAHFSFFGGIRLDDVRLFLPGSHSRQPFFNAERVIMRHQPWGLMVSGQVSPTEIICTKPVVHLEYQADSNATNFIDLLAGAQQTRAGSGGGWKMKLPPIRMREGQLAISDVSDPDAVQTVPLDVTMLPQGEDDYVITFEESGSAGRHAMQGEVRVDIASGAVIQARSTLPLERLERTLPLQYRQWRSRYGLTGDVQIARSEATTSIGGLLEAELVDVSMKLPIEEGGVELVQVVGTLIFADEGVTLKNISGRIPQAGNARFEMSGHYEGYGPDAPCEVQLKVEDMTIPPGQTEMGGMSEALAAIQEMFQPQGRTNLQVSYRRDSSGEVSFEGVIEPQGMTVTYKHFAYRLENVRGRITFTPHNVRVEGLTAERGAMRCSINGEASNLDGSHAYDVSVSASDVALDSELRAAMPNDFESVWHAVNPSGRTGVKVRVWRQGDADENHLDLGLALDGKASMEYSGFPYRVDNLIGEVAISGKSVRIPGVSGSRGPVSCSIHGSLDDVGADTAVVDLALEGRDLPIDDVLAQAAGRAGRQVLQALNMSGSAEQFQARVWKQREGGLEYEVSARMKDVSIAMEQFPYPIEGTSGLLKLVPGKAIVESLAGSHGQTAVAAEGVIYMSSENQIGLDLKLTATDLTLDDEVRDALPKTLQETWRQLQPTGSADLQMSIRHDVSGSPGTDYEMLLRAKDMGITYAEFPYPLRGISGDVIARPGKLVLQDLRLHNGAMEGALSGVLTTEESRDEADLKVSLQNVPIDQDLLKAVPGELAPLSERFEPGGTCDFEFERLHVVRDRPLGMPASAAASAPASQPSSAPRGSKAWWQVTGSTALHDAAVSLGFGRKTITGGAIGNAGMTDEGLAVDADVDLDNVSVGSYSAKHVVGKLSKSPSSKLLRLDNLEAETCGGRLAGFAQVELDSPLRYGINLTVDRVKLEELLAPQEAQGAASQPAREKVAGLIDGSMELVDTVGRPDDRQARGVLRISQARLYRLPVLLDMLTVVVLSLPRDSAFTEGEFIYHLRGGELVFEEIYLRGPQMSLVGSGKMNLTTQRLQLTFLSGPPGALPRLSGMAEDVLVGIFREMAEIEVSGTISEPRTRTRALGSLEDAIRRLLNPEEEGR